jgi:hypothetical protein
MLGGDEYDIKGNIILLHPYVPTRLSHFRGITELIPELHNPPIKCDYPEEVRDVALTMGVKIRPKYTKLSEFVR